MKRGKSYFSPAYSNSGPDSNALILDHITERIGGIKTSKENELLDSLKNRIRLPSIDKDHIVSKGKALIPVQYRSLQGLRDSVWLQSVHRDNIVQKGRDLLDSGSSYEAMFYDKISRYSFPSISQVYANSQYKTRIYRADEESPCLDEILYKHESLIPYGKEYWFAIFTSLDGRKPMQLVSCFGRRNSRRSIVNDIEVNGLNPTGAELSTGAFAWGYDGKKKLLVEPVVARTVADGKSITTTGEGLDFVISGTVPQYRVKIDSKPITCDFTLNKPSSGYDEEVLNELKMGLNYQVYNLYYNFTGTLNGEEHSGRCYLQKVILSTPMVPWNWCRLVFKDGSFLVFFKPYFGSKEFNYPLRNKGCLYSAKHDRLFWFYNIDVTSDAKGNNWRFRCTEPEYSLDLSVHSYGHHVFSFRYGGTFSYNEYLVTVKKFSFESGDVVLCYKDTGAGAGMVEDATGILI
jgi:hypothetical protein